MIKCTNTELFFKLYGDQKLMGYNFAIHELREYAKQEMDIPASKRLKTAQKIVREGFNLSKPTHSIQGNFMSWGKLEEMSPNDFFYGAEYGSYNFV